MKHFCIALVLIICTVSFSACHATPAAISAPPQTAYYDTQPMFTKTPVPTPTPSPTPTPVPVDTAEVAAFSQLFEAAPYAFICKVSQDIGTVNLAKDMSPLSDKTYLGERQYALSVIQPVKSAEIPIEEGMQILLSIPHEYGVTSSKYDKMAQPGYVTLGEGETYLILVTYERNFEFFSPMESSASVFAIEDGWVYLHTNDDSVRDSWLENADSIGIAEEALFAAIEALSSPAK